MWTEKELYSELNYVDHSRAKRSYYAHLVLENSELIQPLIKILFMVDDKLSSRAAWVLEFVCSKQLDCIVPHLNDFTSQLSKIHLDAAVRPAAKICEILIKTYYSNKNTLLKANFSQKHKERITEACFDWMSNDVKIAPKAYSMNCLYLLGTEFDWIHPELKNILERDFQMQSSGFKARARHILKKLNAKL